MPTVMHLPPVRHARPRTTMRLREDLLKALGRRARALGVSRSYLIEAVLAGYAIDHDVAFATAEMQRDPARRVAVDVFS